MRKNKQNSENHSDVDENQRNESSAFKEYKIFF